MVASNTYGRQTVLPLTNKSGGGVIAGDVVVIASANTDAFTTTTSAATTAIVGVAQETIANNATGRICLGGYVPLVNVNASCTVLHYGATHTVAKQATDVGTSRIAGACMVFLTTSATPDAYLYNPDLGGASLTNPMTTKGDIILGDTGGTPTRLAAGVSGLVLVAAGAGAFPAWGTAIVRSTIGTTSIGGSFRSPTGTTYLKKVTLATDGFLASIMVGVKGDGANNGGINVGVLSDSAGVPVNVLAGASWSFNAAAGTINYGFLLNTTARTITVPVGVWLTAADYWLAATINTNSAGGIQMAYSAGTGSDKTQAIQRLSDVSFISTSNTTDDHSIAANILR